MNRSPVRSATALSVALVGVASVAAAQRAVDASSSLYDSLATVIVTKSVAVQPNEDVLISAPPRLIGLLDALNLAVTKAGGRPFSQVASERSLAYMLTEMPIDRVRALTSPGAVDRALLPAVDVSINIYGYDSDFGKLLAGLSKDRTDALVRRSEYDSLALKGHTRSFSMWVPGPADTIGTGLSLDSVRRRAMTVASVDPEAMRAVAASLADRIGRARQLTVTTAASTRFVVRILPGSSVLDVGRLTREEAEKRTPGARNVGLPAGILAFLIVPESVDGTIKGVNTWCFGDSAATDVSVSIARGTPRDARAASRAECVRTRLVPVGPASWLSIGVNPKREPGRRYGALMIPPTLQGAVTLGFGNNLDVGGSNASELSWALNIGGATVTADADTLVRNGAIVGARSQR